jgi:hypothetical protein
VPLLPAETWPKHSVATSGYHFARDLASIAPGETWPGQAEHHRHHGLMLAEHATTGIYRDPVSGRTFPPGQAMLRGWGPWSVEGEEEEGRTTDHLVGQQATHGSLTRRQSLMMDGRRGPHPERAD